MVVIDEAVLDRFRAAGRCEICFTYRTRRDPHHHVGRGMGGGTRCDIPENLIALCRTCHDKVGNLKIMRSEVLELIAKREKKTPKEIMEIIGDKLAQKK